MQKNAAIILNLKSVILPHNDVSMNGKQCRPWSVWTSLGPDCLPRPVCLNTQDHYSISQGTPSNNLSHDMTKPTKCVGVQRRLKSAWADLSLRWAHSRFVGFVMSWLICDIFENCNSTRTLNLKKL